MASLAKLSIQGVRSYSDQKAEVVQFYRPLTIIVGANGSGKTSIIEALKFACTGKPPPLSDGGKSFVHDPKAVGSNIVKAQIKLLFNNVTADPVLAIRSFQVSQNARSKKPQYKQLEGVLRTKDEHGEPASISHGCSDMDKQMPMLLGVSRAVLENVIFCHQEESNWPLGDANTLKANFDAIFSATRYSKALDAIRKLRKDQTALAKELEADLRVLERDQEQAGLIRAELQQAQRGLEGYLARIAEAKEEEKAASVRVEELDAVDRGTAQLRQQVDRLQAEREVMVRDLEEAQLRMNSELTDSDDELQLFYKNLLRTMREGQAELERTRERLTRHRQDSQQQEERRRSLLVRQGQQEVLQRQHRELKQNIAQRGDRLREQHSLEAASGKPDQLRQALEALRDRRRQELSAHRDRSRGVDEEFESRINQITQRRGQLKQEYTMKQQEMERLRQKIQQLAAQQERLAARLVGSEDLDSQIAEVRRSLDAHTEEPREQEIARRTAALQSELRGLQTELQQLARSRAQLEGQQQALAEADQRSRHLQEQLEAHNRLLRSLDPQLAEAGLRQELVRPLPEQDRTLLADVYAGEGRGKDCYSPDLEFQAKQQLDTVSARLTEEQRQLGKGQAELGGLEQEVRGLRGRIETMEQRLTEHRHRIQRAHLDFEAPADDLQAQTEALDTRVHELVQEAEGAQQTLEMFSKFMRLTEKKHECFLCCRGLDDPELQSFMKTNRQRLDRMQERAESGVVNRQLDQAREQLKQLQELAGPWSEARRLEDRELPELRSQLERRQTSLTDRGAEIRQRQESETELRKRRDALVSLHQKGQQLTERFEHIRVLLVEVQSSEARLRAEANRAGGRSLQELVRETDRVQAEQQRHQEELAELQRELEQRNRRRTELQNRYNELRERGIELAGLQQDRARMRSEAEAAQSQVDSNKQSCDKLEGQAERQKADLLRAREERTQQREQLGQTERGLTDRLAELDRELTDFGRLLEQVQSSGRRLQETQDLQRQIDEAASRCDRLQQEIRTHTENLEQLEAHRAQHQTSEVDVQANLDFRMRRRSLEAKERQLAQLRGELQQRMGGLEELRGRVQRERQELDRCKIKVAGLQGRADAEREQTAKLQQDLNMERYHDVDDRCRRMQIRVQTTVLSAQDLELYHKALDQAMLRYHSDKMQSINEVLKEYWRSTYKGRDIDEVYLQAEAAEPSDGGPSKGRRSYNYRVMMRSGDTEMEMRGRCSAGQKVLACLLIRLALAETFCLQCGVLALDEPTTNLDTDNVTGFAKALTRIINKRREQSNFQLILITHDEQFVEEIGQRAHADFYWRVHKDSDGHSRIRRQAFVE